jgi:hypothetical protein
MFQIDAVGAGYDRECGLSIDAKHLRICSETSRCRMFKDQLTVRPIAGGVARINCDVAGG